MKDRKILFLWLLYGQQARRLGLPDERLCYRAAIYYSLMTEIYVKAEPDSKSFQIKNGSIPTVYLEKPAENGKANQELKNKLEGITGADVGIISGTHSRRKKLAIDMPEKEFRKKLEER